MLDKSIFPFKKLAFSTIAIMGLCFLAGDIMAQTEKEVIESDNVKSLDRPLTENASTSLEPVSSTAPKAREAISTSKTKKGATLKKTTTLGSEGKKPEASPSTMSFNIFLYIVDKFKED